MVNGRRGRKRGGERGVEDKIGGGRGMIGRMMKRRC